MIFPTRRFRRSISAMLVGLALTLSLGAAQPHVARAEAPSAGPTRERERMNARVFDTVWNTVRRQYYDPRLHGVDWRAARATYRPRAVAAPDDRTLYRAMGQMLDLLDDDHAGVSAPAVVRRQDQLRSRRAVMGVTLYLQDDGSYRIENVRPGSPAEAAGIGIGWRLDAIDGTDWGPDNDVFEGVPVLLRLADEAGLARELTVIPRVMDPVPAFSADASRPGVVVLRIEAFEPGLGRWLGDRLAETPPQTDVVLDLRGNPGGLLLEADAALSCFLPARLPWATRTSRAGRPVTLSIMSGCGDLVAPAPNDVAVLVDRSSRSAAELTPAALQEAGRALVVGEHTAGSVLISQDNRLPDGGRLTLSRADYVTAGGVRLEKQGVAPDIVAVRSLDDRRSGRDPALESALSVLALEPEAQRAQALSRRPSF